MAEKLQKSLVNFMKKQADTKILKHQDTKKSTPSLAAEKTKDKKDNDDETEDLSDEEKLEEAKKESRGKSENYDQVAMFRKLIVETTIKYVLLISLLMLFAFGLIKLTPAFLDMLHGLFFRVFIG